MKSYSDDIPNISTEELKRNSYVGEETNALVKENLVAIRAHDDVEKKRLEEIDAHVKTCFRVMVVTLLVSITSMGTSLFILLGN